MTKVGKEVVPKSIYYTEPHQEVDGTVHLKGRVFTNDHKD